MFSDVRGHGDDGQGCVNKFSLRYMYVVGKSYLHDLTVCFVCFNGFACH